MNGRQLLERGKAVPCLRWERLEHVSLLMRRNQREDEVMGKGKDHQWKPICRKELLIEPIRTYRTCKSYSCLQIDYCLTEGRMCSQPQKERKAWLQVQMSLRFRWWEAEVWSVENEKWWGKDLQRVQKVLNFNPGEVGEWSFDHWGHMILLVFSGRTRVSPWAFLTYKNNNHNGLGALGVGKSNIYWTPCARYWTKVYMH